MSTTTKYTPVLCIGLGLSGLCLGMQLKRKYGLNFADMHFYDRNDGYSGTWWVNRYPGECRSDILRSGVCATVLTLSFVKRTQALHGELRRVVLFVSHYV
jgi:hypothetical protein